MKTQQQTLSVRISDAMRRRLESARHLIAKKTGEPLSISEVANRFLETAQDDNFEASELFSRPTETLINIRRKLERGQSVSRAQWQVFGYYLQDGCESPTEEPQLPSAESYAVLLEAFLAALALRTGKNPELDYEYLWNLVSEPLRPETDVTVEAIIKAARQHIRRLRDPSSAARKWAPVFIGRNLRFLFSDERLRRIEALNETLRPHLTVLFRIAARGHYLREGRPGARAACRAATTLASARPRRRRWWLATAASRSRSRTTMSLAMLLDLEPQRVLYPLEPYPVIREFAAMLKALKPGEQGWMGREFFGYTGQGRTAFNFRRRRNGIVIAFSAEEWRALGELMDRALALPEMQLVLEDSWLAYGEF
jgi:hypothetical protein